jgi:diaminopimelate decarboxylase
VLSYFRLAVNFDTEEDDSSTVPSLTAYAQLLKETSPELFSGDFKVITEFGRRYNAKPGFFVSRLVLLFPLNFQG